MNKKRTYVVLKPSIIDSITTRASSLDLGFSQAINIIVRDFLAEIDDSITSTGLGVTSPKPAPAVPPQPEVPSVVVPLAEIKPSKANLVADSWQRFGCWLTEDVYNCGDDLDLQCNFLKQIRVTGIPYLYEQDPYYQSIYETATKRIAEEEEKKE